MHQRVIVIYIHFKFHEILFSGYLDMASDGRTDRRRTDAHGQNIIPSPSAGVITTINLIEYPKFIWAVFYQSVNYKQFVEIRISTDTLKKGRDNGHTSAMSITPVAIMVNNGNLNFSAVSLCRRDILFLTPC